MGSGQLITNRFLIGDPDRDLLGRGGMGEVYRATDSQTGETVAVKALNPNVLAHDPDLLARFLREGEALRQLNHPNIVHMIAACEEDGCHYLVMEYVPGRSLQQLLDAEHRLPPQRAIEISLDLADALTRAHRLGIIHRDLKPANVLLAADGTPRLADFGLAHLAAASPLTQSGMLMGTVDYLSPEACRGEPLDERADIWAFGVMLFEMLSGQAPFGGDSLTARLTAILTRPVPDLAALVPGLPDGLVDLVYRMLEKDRQQRIPSVRLVGAELEALLKGREPITPVPTGRVQSRFAAPTPAAETPLRDAPALSALAAGAVLGVQLLGDFRLTYGDQPLTTVNTPRLQALLAYLILHRHAPQARRHLAFLFWPDTNEAQALTNLRNLLHKLRQALPDPDSFFDADTHAVHWRVDSPSSLDVVEFESLARSTARADLERATALYRGELLPSCYDDWIVPERER